RTLLDMRSELLAFVERRVGSRAVAEDILQDALTQGLGSLGSLRNGAAVKAWFYTLLRRAIIDHQRRQGTAKRALSLYAHQPEPPSAADPAGSCQCVSRLVTTLKPEYR